jgi:pyruvate dehydrogenase E2 component (dihydrolipoamide acetyltransferase)
MSHSITIPRLGWSMEEGVFAEWLKSPGEYVRAGEMIFLLEGEKAAQEVESFDSGYLCIPPDAPQPGATVQVGEVIGFLLAEGEPAPASVHVQRIDSSPTPPLAADSMHSKIADSPAATVPSSPRVAGPAARRLARELGIDLNAVITPDPTGRVLTEDIRRIATLHERNRAIRKNAKEPIATPRARRRARELGVDWNRLMGTGRGGRIRERDVLTASLTPQVANTVSEPSPSVLGHYVPASKLRRVIAQRMMAGVHQAAPVTLTTKVDAQSLASFREKLKLDASHGTVPSYNDILIGLTAQTLREFPELNACWYREGIYNFEEIHIATAIDTPDGLLAPVVRHADRLTLIEIAGQTKQLIQLARTGQLKQEHLAGGTFTVTNLGMFGIDAFTPILNLPQAAILGIGRIIEEAVVRDGRLEVGLTLTLSLTFDHRVVDGAPAARFLQAIATAIAYPAAALLS